MIYMDSYDGAKIAVHLWNRQSQKAVLLLHGWPFSYQMFESQISLLVRRGYLVVAPDMRGFGISSEAGQGYGYDSLATDIYRVIAGLKLQKCTAAGFGMGGAVLLRYMTNYKGYGIGKLILMAAVAPGLCRTEMNVYGQDKDDLDKMIHRLLTDRPKMVQDISRQMFACPKSEAYMDWFYQMALNGSGLGTVMAAVTMRDENVEKDLKNVCVPATIIHGGRDCFVSREMADIQHRDIVSGFRKRGWGISQPVPVSRYCLKNSGHGIGWDEMEEFNCLFLREVIQ